VKRFSADLHIHTALSPCASDEMTPPAIVRAAIEEGLAMIAICDHNTTGNIAATQEAAGRDVTVLAGMEITTAEEVHVLAVFPDANTARAVSEKVRATLPERSEACRRFGEQRLMDATGLVVGVERKMLSASSAFGLIEVVDLIKGQRGLAIAAHVERPSFSVLSQLGMFPTDISFDAVEISAAAARPALGSKVSRLGLPVISCSDSHFLADVGTCSTALEIREPTFLELCLALKGVDGRRCCNA